MEIKDIMTRNARSCTPDTNLREAAAGQPAVKELSAPQGQSGTSPPTRWLAPALAERRVPKGAGQEPLKVRDVMSREVTSCRPRDTLASAALAMNRADGRFLPVVDAAGRPVGVITDGDICLLGATDNRPLRDIYVQGVMNQPVTTCGPDTDILEVLRMMRSRRIRHVPVVGADGVLVGIVSLTDLVLCAEERGDRCFDPVCHEIAAAVREIAQKNPGGRYVRLPPFIED